MFLFRRSFWEERTTSQTSGSPSGNVWTKLPLSSLGWHLVQRGWDEAPTAETCWVPRVNGVGATLMTPAQMPANWLSAKGPPPSSASIRLFHGAHPSTMP